MAQEELLGQVVTSRAGRDRGRAYVVVGTAGADMVLVADGQRRGMDRPKKKNVRHLVLHGPAPDLVEKLRAGQTLRDEEVRTALERLAPPAPAGGTPGRTARGGEGPRP